MAFRTRDEDEYTRRVINCEWSFQVNQERRISLNFSRVFLVSISMLEMNFEMLVADYRCW